MGPIVNLPMFHYMNKQRDRDPDYRREAYVPMSIGKGRAITEKMYFLYILQSEKNSRYYIGSTSNLDRRLLEHNSGKTKSIKHHRPFKIVFSKEFDSALEAMQLERKLKKFKSKRIIERVVREQKLIMGL